MHLDCATVKVNDEKGTKSVWRIMVKERTGMKDTEFFKTKDGTVEPTVEQLHQCKTEGISPTVLCMDNAGENKLSQDRAESADWKLGLSYEFTARRTPQQNSIAEVAFTTITGQATAMMDAA